MQPSSEAMPDNVSAANWFRAGVDAGCAKSAWRGGRQALDRVTGADPLRSEPTLLHFHRIEREAARPVCRFVLRLHVFDVYDRALRVDECDRQGNVRVLHPEAE